MWISNSQHSVGLTAFNASAEPYLAGTITGVEPLYNTRSVSDPTTLLGRRSARWTIFAQATVVYLD